MRHIIFDLDGTIIDSKKEILKTYKLVFDQIPPAVAPDLEKLNYGLTLGDLMKSVYGDEPDKIAKAKQLFASVYDTSDYAETTLYEGVVDTLNALKKEGYEMYIATNKRLLPTRRILERKQIGHLFSHIMANEMVPGVTFSKRQMIEGLKKMGSFSEGFMVGDAITDIQAGNEERLLTVAVNYGYEDADILAAQHPSISIDHFDKLYTFVVEACRKH